MAARKLTLNIVGDSRSAVKAFKTAGKSADTFHGKVTNAAKGITKGLAIAGVAIAGIGIALGIKSVKAAAKFETSMSRIIGLAGQSRKQVGRWSDQLLSLGPALAKSPQELAQALYFITSSGIPASKAIDALTASAKASTAGLGETEVVADAVTSVMNAYAASNMTAVRATDVLVATVREGKGEADAFAGVIGNVAAFAAKVKVPFEEVGAALAAMTQLGTDPETAATQLQAFFSSVFKVGKKARDASPAGFFEDLQETLQNKGLLAALKKIKAAFRGDIVGMTAAFPNIRALRALLALTAEDGGKVEGVFARMANSSGSLKTAFAASTKTSETNFKRLGAVLDALKIAFGQGLLPMVNKVATALGKKLMNPQFIERVRNLGTLIGTGLFNAFTKVWDWFNANWPAIVNGFQGAVKFAGAVATGVERIATAIERMVTKAQEFNEWTSNLPGGDKGGHGILGQAWKFFSTNPLLETGYAAPGEVLGRKGGGKKGGGKGAAPNKHINRRAFGGRVARGAAYTVGERGPEMFTPSTSGKITPGGGGPTHIHVHVGSHKVAEAVIGDIQRLGKRGASQQRGRLGGQNLALG